MITFNYETQFQLSDEKTIKSWIKNIILKKGFEVGEINYIFCVDTYLHKLNLQFLNHDTLTDIISFDNTVGNLISGDIFISIERVKDNAIDYKVSFEEELHRVMIHGVLHYLGFKDKTEKEIQVMRKEENKSILILNKK